MDQQSFDFIVVGYTPGCRKRGELTEVAHCHRVEVLELSLECCSPIGRERDVAMNIDNGFGAAAAALKIQGVARRQRLPGRG